MSSDPLRDAEWSCWAQQAGDTSDRSRYPDIDDRAVRFPAIVPTTAAAVVRAAGHDSDRDFDAEDWFFRTEFDLPTSTAKWTLTLRGLATVCDVWLNGEHVLSSDSMFVEHDVAVGALPTRNELLVRCAALNPVLAMRRPRPRWRVARLRSQNLRWLRTTLLGRLEGWVSTPAPVGPWRPILLTETAAPPTLTESVLQPSWRDGMATLHVSVAIAGADSASVTVGGVDAALVSDGAGTFSATVQLPDARPWWPHTHGDQPLYAVAVQADGVEVDLGRVGFRSVEADRSDDGFSLRVNGVAVFCRGAYWMPPDAVGLAEEPDRIRANLAQMRAANMNVVRVGGETIYPGRAFLDLCDELGLLVWHDCMFAFVDVPDDADVLSSIDLELRQQLRVWQGHPCIAVVSGGAEIEQQATYQGLSRDAVASRLFAAELPSLVELYLPGTPYVSSSPTGGAVATDPRSGISHYYGVGAYLRPPDDARRAGVRFAAECLAFATPPERVTIDEACGGPARAGHHPDWKRAVYRDAGASWDFEDVRDHYVRTLFGVDPAALRFTEPERALDLGRAVVAHLFSLACSEWRRVGSTCAGAIVFHNTDLRPGAGLGVVDALGRPKAPWYVMRRIMAPVAVVVTDEGLNGLDLHLLNDGADDLRATIEVRLYAHGEVCVETVEQVVVIPARGGTKINAATMFDGFRDINNAHLFGAPAWDAAGVSLRDEDGVEIAQAVHLVGESLRVIEPDLGLTARLHRDAGGAWSLTVATRRLAQWVAIDVSGAVPTDSWFHLLPGTSRVVGLGSAEQTPRGRVRALNCASSTRLTAEE